MSSIFRSLWVLFSLHPFLAVAQIDPGPNPGDTSSVSFTYLGSPVRYTTVRTNDGKVWLQQNLGASRVAVNTKDTASYGDYFQWGRWDDGHQRPAGSTILASQLSANNPGGLMQDTGFVLNFWWLGGGNADTWSGSPPSATNGLDPCAAIGPGWRLPSVADWQSLVMAEGIGSDTASAINSNLRLPPAGYRGYEKGGIVSRQLEGGYWTTTLRENSISAYLLYFTGGMSTFSLNNYMARGHGFSARCMKNCQAVDSITAVVCPGQTFTRPNGAVVTHTGVYFDVIGLTDLGCDSVVVSDVTVVSDVYEHVTIEGNRAVCVGSEQTYRIPGLSGITSYNWTLPAGWIADIRGHEVTVRVGDQGGVYIIRAYVITACDDTSSVVELPVYVSDPEALIDADGHVLRVPEHFIYYQWYRNDSALQDGKGHKYTATANGSYKVVVTDEYGCSDTSDVVKITHLGVDPQELSGSIAQLYPNPAKGGVVHVSSSVPVYITLFNAEGKAVIRRTHTDRLSVSGLAPGIFMLIVTDEQGNILNREKLIVTE